MANKFVWSGAGGANDGSKWEDAYTSLVRDWGAEAGFTPGTDFIYVRSVHSESSGGPLTIWGSTAEGSTPVCRIICCVGAATGTSPGALATGASVTVNDATDNILEEGLYIYGVEFYSADDIVLGAIGNDTVIELEKCRLELTGASDNDDIRLGTQSSVRAGHIRFIDVDIDFALDTQGIELRNTAFEWIGGSCERDCDNLFELPSAGGSRSDIVGVDLSAMVSANVFAGAAAQGSTLHKISRCIIGSGTTVCDTIDVPGFRVEAYHVQVGTDSDPGYAMEVHTHYGTIKTDTSRYRTGGAKDRERTNPISWDFNTTAGSVRQYPGPCLRSTPITAWTPGDGSTSHTYRIYFASDATIKDDELWIEVELPNDAATNAMASLVSSRVAPLTTAANLSTDGVSSWTGSGVGTKQYVEVTHTPDKPGPVSVRIYMAKASDNIYIDPKIVIDP